MAPPPGGDGEAEKIPFRWLDAARYAAASVVTVLIIIVIVKASRVVLVPGSLYVSVVQGSIFFEPFIFQPYDPKVLVFELNLRVDNPRRRARMYYVNVTAYLFDNNTPASSSIPEFDCMAFWRQRDQAVQQQSEVNYFIRVHENNRTIPGFFDWLSSNDSASMSGVTMRLDATLVTEETTYGYNTSRPVTYYCWPLAILRNHGDAAVVGDLGDDVFCRDTRGSRFI